MFFSKIHCNASRAGRIAQCCLLPFLFASVPSLAQVINNGDPNPQVVRISATEYRIGSIVADTAARKLDVPGRVLRRAPPLEYFATTPGGLKAYETLLELDASAFEFNLACILIGLEPAEEGLPQFQFDRHQVPGPRVALSASWVKDGKMVTATAAEMLRAGEDVVADDAWAYTGSMILADGRFLADTTGTLIGFVHDPASIIEHVNGLGIGHYGLLGGNTELVPEEGTPVTLTVRVLATETTESN